MSWQRAPMIAELQMDLLVQMPDNYLYGPTNVATIQEFLATGEIDENVTIINCLDNTEARLADLGWFRPARIICAARPRPCIGTVAGMMTRTARGMPCSSHALSRWRSR
jgi:hypothetical protein